MIGIYLVLGAWDLVFKVMVSIRKELAQYALVSRKRWGQHFLTDRNILNKVIRAAQLKKDDVVLEVGPGLGEMTLAMAPHVRKVVAVEIDRQFLEILREKTVETPNIEVIHGDVLKIDFIELFCREGQRLKVVANLPYQISTPLLFRFIELKELFSTFTLMLQKEVAERIVALPGKKAYGPLSVFIQSFLNPSVRFSIKPSAFFPSPRVESAVLSMGWKEKPVVRLEDEAWFKRVVRGCLGYRRKRLINALKYSNLPLPGDARGRLEKIGIDPQRRPDTLAPQEFALLAEALKP